MGVQRQAAEDGGIGTDTQRIIGGPCLAISSSVLSFQSSEAETLKSCLFSVLVYNLVEA